MDKVAIELTNGGVFYVSKEDAEWVKQRKWYLWSETKPSGFTYSHIRQACKGPILHSVIMNPGKNERVKHLDNDPLNNTRENLRIINISQCQAGERKTTTPTSSEYKGVYWDTQRDKWRVQIKVNEKRIFLGRYENEDDAARAYNEAAKKYFGEFARLNEIKNETVI